MQDRTKLLAGIVALSCIMSGCTKKAEEAADTVTASHPAAAPMDQAAESRAIVAIDSAWMRHVIAKNVDSLMTYYTSDAVSYGFGPPASGSDQIRAIYTDMVKSTISNPTINEGGVKFSEDGTMAYDYGTYTMTVTPPGGKASNQSGAYLNIWKKVDGQWKIAAEMSTPVTPPKM